MMFDFHFETRVGYQDDAFDLHVCCQSDAKRLVMMGASGSGKSLTLQILAGLWSSVSGSLKVNGRVYLDSAQGIDVPTQKREVGVMFQDYALFPHLTVAQNIAFGRHVHWRNPPHRIDETTERWLQRMQLTHVAKHYPHQISGGQKQRVALARACAIEPRWLLLDEPFSALDRDLRQQMRLELLDLQRELDLPMLLVSHDVEDAECLADEIWYMNQGILRKEPF